MKVEFKNLAQIESAIIEDSQLTIIVGDNGVGKTLLLEAKTLLSNFYAEKIEEIAKEIINENSGIVDILMDWEELYYFIYNKVNNPLDEESFDLDMKYFQIAVDFKGNFSLLNKEFREKLNLYYKEAIKEVKEKVIFDSTSEFSFDFLELPRVEENPNLNFMIIDSNARFFTYSIKRINNNGKDYSEGGLVRLDNIFNSEKYMTNENIIKKIPKALSTENAFKEKIQEKIKLDTLLLLFKYYFRDGENLFLPSERNLYVDNALRKAINEMRKNEGENSGKKYNSRYSEYLFNVSYLEYIDSINRFNNYGLDVLGTELSVLEKLFGGKLNFAENGEPESIYKEGKIVKRELFSTKENRIIPYILIFDPFKHYNQIIIEEPEAHLSLKSMYDLVEFISKLIELEKNVLITTHSDVFFSRINNLLIKNKEINSRVYEMKTSSGGSILEEKRKTEYGYEIDLFSDELNNLFEETLSTQDGDINDNK